MHVDLGVEIARDRKDAIDLRTRIGVEIRRGADGPRAAAQAFDQEFLGAGIVSEAFLRKHAELHVHRPGVVARQPADCLEAGHADAGIEFDMGAHAHRAVRNAALKRVLCSRVNVFGGEVALGSRGDPHRFRDGALLDMAAVEDAGLVEMDVRLDQTGNDEGAGRIQLAPIGLEGGRDDGYRAAVDTDIDAAKLTILHNAGVSNDQIHQLTTAGCAPR